MEKYHKQLEANTIMQGKGHISFIADSGATEHVLNSHEYYTVSEKVDDKRLRSTN